jgi:hypothetical protein
MVQKPWYIKNRSYVNKTENTRSYVEITETRRPSVRNREGFCAKKTIRDSTRQESSSSASLLAAQSCREREGWTKEREEERKSGGRVEHRRSGEGAEERPLPCLHPSPLTLPIKPDQKSRRISISRCRLTAIDTPCSPHQRCAREKCGGMQIRSSMVLDTAGLVHCRLTAIDTPCSPHQHCAGEKRGGMQIRSSMVLMDTAGLIRIRV